MSEGLTGFWLCESLDSLPPVSRWITVSSRFFENETTKTGIHLSEEGPNGIQYIKIQILLSTPHGGFSETNINSTGNQKNIKQKKYSRIVNIQLLRNYLHIEFMTSQIDYQ